jgi:RNA polymerase sigma factor (TIGR02999 family)
MSNSSNRREQIDRYLEAIRGGNAEAFDALTPFIYDELRRQAHRMLRRERQGHTLQTTALVHEAYINLVGSPSKDWDNLEHFFNVAAKVMRHILVNHARRKCCLKRNGGRLQKDIELDDLPDTNKPEVLVLLDDTLTELRTINKRQAEIVENRFFAGLTNDEIAKLMKISETTVKREWRQAKAWLLREMKR